MPHAPITTFPSACTRRSSTAHVGLGFWPLDLSVSMLPACLPTRCLRKGTYEQVSVNSGVGRTECWHEYKSLRKHGINFISKPVDKLDHRCAGTMLNFNFVCIVASAKLMKWPKTGVKLGQKGLKYFNLDFTKKNHITHVNGNNFLYS